MSHFQNCCSHFDTVSEYTVHGKYITVKCCTYKFTISIQIDQVSISLILGGLSLQQLEAGLWFPASVEVRLQGWEHWTPASRPVVNDKSPSPSPLQRRIPTKMESSETSSVLKAYIYVWIDTLSESPTLLVVWITSMGHFFWVSFAWSSWFAWFWVCIWYPSGSSTWVCASFSQDGIQ